MFYYFWNSLKFRNMNRKLLFTILVAGMISATGLNGQITYVGVAGHYGTSIKEFGVGANALYTINEKIDIAPGLVYFFPHKEDYYDGYRRNTWWSVNIDGHYIPFANDYLQAYGLMGLNFTSVEVKRDYTFQGQEFKDKKTTLELGLNIGGGIQFNLAEKIAPFAEAKYTLGEADQLVFSLGIIFRIMEDKVRESPEDF
jgi:outer membrane immunogenic protein